MSTSTEIRSNFGSLKTAPGAILVMVGFVTVYFIAGLGRRDVPGAVEYLGLAFGFVVALGGMALLFRETSAGAGADASVSASDVEHAVAQLSKNYDILRRQASQGFTLALISMALGVLVILAGSAGELFGLTGSGGKLTTVAGVLVETVSALGLYLFKDTFKRLNQISDRLHETWGLLAAFRRCQDLPEAHKAHVATLLIYKLAGISDVAVPKLPDAEIQPKGTLGAG